MRVYASKRSQVFHISVMSVYFIMLIFSAYAHASDKEVKQKVSEAASAIGDYTIEQKDAAVAKAKELMDQLDQKTSELEIKIEKNWDTMKAATRESYQQSLKEMRGRRNQLSEWYGEMKQSSKDAWGGVKQGFADTYDKVVNAYNDTEEKMNTKEKMNAKN